MSKRETVVIPSYTKAPSGEKPTASYEQINSWLSNTDPGYIRGSGQTYTFASGKVNQAVSALETHAARISQIWKGPDAAKAREALLLLHATGLELADKMQKMGSALTKYADDLTTAKEEAQKTPIWTSGSGNHTAYGSGHSWNLIDSPRDKAAQEALHKLNTEIVSIYNFEVPQYIMYELPTVSLPGGSGGYGDPGYPTGSGGRGPTFGSLGSDPTGGGGTTQGGPTSGGTTPGITYPGGTNPGGTNPDGTNPGATDPGGTNPGGSDPDGSSDPNPDGSTPPGAQDPASPEFQDPGQNTQPDDGTTPPVIGGEDQTTTDGRNPVDPRRTDLAFTPPPNTVTPTTFTPTTPTVNPPGVLTPIGSSPGTPSVIGSPGVGGPGQVSMLAGGRGAPGMAGGMPMMPMMGGGAGGGGGHSDLERTTYLSEDPNSWTTAHDTTDPVIG
ncbi:MAG TPA: hypothetical protein VKZ82_00525 [Nonomuraea sp.]|nr:hypothetical protein [Nonomuraea sp.]